MAEFVVVPFSEFDEDIGFWLFCGLFELPTEGCFPEDPGVSGAWVLAGRSSLPCVADGCGKGDGEPDDGDLDDGFGAVEDEERDEEEGED